MKKLITVVIIGTVGGHIGNSFAAPNCCGSAPCAVYSDVTFDSSCTANSICLQCKNTTTTSNGVTTTTPQNIATYCIGSTAYARCDTGITTYQCASGYYGTATSGSAGCTICPSNATCSGGNNSTFVCNKGYYKNGTSCTACPSSGTTSTTGATAITQCYIPTGTSFSDSTGSGTYTGNCYYSN